MRILGSGFGVRATLLASVAVMVTGAASAAQAQSDQTIAVDEVIVTAQKRAENVQDVPLSISAYSGEMMEKAGVTSLTDLATTVPSFSVDQSSNARNTTVAVRGIGTSGTNPGIEPSVGIFVDGVYLSSAGMVQGELLDIASVEVLRGPQGTLYGRNTPVGAVNINTRRPTADSQARLRAGVGDYDLRYVNAYLSGALTEGLAGSLSFWTRDRGGYETNLTTGRDINDAETYGARGRLAFSVGSDIEVDLIAYYSKMDQVCCVPDHLDPTGPYGVATPGFLAAQLAAGRTFVNYDGRDHIVHANDDGQDVVINQGLSAQLRWQIFGDHEFVSISAYQNWDNDASVQAGAMPVSVLINNQITTYNNFSQEFRLTSPTGQRLEYIAGVFLFAQDTFYRQDAVVGSGANRLYPASACGTGSTCRVTAGDSTVSIFDQETSSVAVFGTATYHLTDAFDVTGGLRYSYDRKEANIQHTHGAGTSLQLRNIMPANIIGDVEREEDNITWSANARWRPTDNLMFFATAATGYKTGGFNSRRVRTGIAYEFEPETSRTIELGGKAELLDRRLVVNATLFDMKLSDFQESVADTVNGTGFIVGNAGERAVRGVEVDFRAQPTAAISLDGGISYLDAEFTDRSDGPCPVDRAPNGSAPGSCNFNGLRPERSPEWKYSLAATYTGRLTDELEWSVRGEVSYTGGQYMEATLDEPSYMDAYTLVNLRATLGSEDGRWQVAAWARNLTDEVYYYAISPLPATGYMSGGGTTPARGWAGWYAPPRTLGVELSLRY